MISGSIVALVTPMHVDGSVDWDALKNLVEWHIEQKTDAIVAVGTTGESATLDMDEHIQVIKTVVDVANKRLPVIAGTGANATMEALELTEKAKGVGADACLLVSPYYNKPTQEGLFLHHKYIADRVAIPQILYNVPGRTQVDFQAETVARLSQVDNIVGIKEATPHIERVGRYLADSKQGFAVYCGEDPLAADYILAGAKGNISVTANVAPKAMAEMCAQALAGNEVALAQNQQLAELHTAMFLESNPIPVKWALSAMDKIDLGIRLPLTVLSDHYQPTVLQALKNAGLVHA